MFLPSALVSPPAASAAGSATAYVVNSGANSVTPVDTATNTAGTPIAVGANPHGIAITPGGTTAFVTNAGGNSVTPINLSTKTPGPAINVGNTPVAVAITPDGSSAYIVNSQSNTVSVMDIPTEAITATISVGNFPAAVAISPNGIAVYVTNSGSNTVSVIDTTTNTVTTTIPVGHIPLGVTFAPDGATAYVTANGSNLVDEIDSATETVVHTVTVGSGPQGIAITPNGATAYVANTGGSTVSAIATATNTVTTIPAGIDPIGVAITPDGSTAYVTNLAGNTVTPIDTTTDIPGTAITVGNGPVGIAMGPAQATTPPDTFIDTTPANPTKLTTAAFTFHASEGSTFECDLDGHGWVACSSPVAYANLAKGSHTFQVRARDSVGTVDPTPAMFQWTSGSPPTVTITGKPASRSTSTSAEFTFRSKDPGATFECSLDGAAFSPCSSPQDYDGLAGGKHTFSVVAVDAAGRQSKPATDRWTSPGFT
jgi:YVTN family beta-propeller protein